jgi:tetratricopeptide (TPR) repeat protein
VKSQPKKAPRIGRPILLSGVVVLSIAALALGTIALLPALRGSGPGELQSRLAEARAAMARGAYDEADNLLASLSGRGADDAEARALLEALTKRRNALKLAESYRDRGEYDRALEIVDGLLLDNPEDATARNLLDGVIAAKRGADTKRTEAERLALDKQQKTLKDSLATLSDTIKEQSREKVTVQPEPPKKAADDSSRLERERVDKINRLTQQGVELLNGGKYAEAKKAFEQLLELDPESAMGQAYLGYTLFQANPDDPTAQQQAIQLLTKSIQKDPSLWQPHDYLGQIYEKSNDTQNALREYKEAARLNPRNFDILYALGKLQYNSRQYDEAARSFGAAASVDPKAARAHFNKAMSLLQTRDFPKALQAFQDAASAQPDYAKAYYEIGKILWKQNQDVPKALTAFRSAVKYDPRNAIYLRNLGEILSTSGNFREAESYFTQALAVEPGHAETNYNLAIVKIGLGAPKDAILYAKAAVDASPSTARYNHQLGLAYESSGDTASAIRYYGLAVQHDATYVAPLVNLGKLYDDGGRYDEALAVLTKAAQLAPEDFAANNNLGNAYAHKGLHQQAMERFQVALRARPTATATRYNLGLSYAELSRDGEAKQAFLDVVKIDATYWDAYLKLARLLVKEGDKQSAKSFLQTLLEKNPRYEKKDEATKLLGQL